MHLFVSYAIFLSVYVMFCEHEIISVVCIALCNICDICTGILIDKVLKVMCETSESFHSILHCSYSAVKKLTAGCSAASTHSSNVEYAHRLHFCSCILLC